MCEWEADVNLRNKVAICAQRENNISRVNSVSEGYQSQQVEQSGYKQRLLNG